MLRLSTTPLILIGLLTLPAVGQTQGTTDTTATDSLAGASPQQNASAGSVLQRRPGSWIQAAIARHNGLIAERLNGPRFGQTSGTQQQSSGSTTSTGTTGTTSITDLLSQLGGLGSLGNLVGNLTGGSTTTGGTTGTNFTLAELIALGQQAGVMKPSNQSTISSSGETTAQSNAPSTNSGRQFGGAIARLPKPEERYQQTTTQPADQPGFGVRWANAMLQTFFTALTLGLQSQDFVDTLTNSLRPLFFPSAGQTSTGDGSSTGGSGTDTSGSSGGDGGTGTGDSGIENLPPTGDTGGGGSTI